MLRRTRPTAKTEWPLQNDQQVRHHRYGVCRVDFLVNLSSGMQVCLKDSEKQRYIVPIAEVFTASSALLVRRSRR